MSDNNKNEELLETPDIENPIKTAEAQKAEEPVKNTVDVVTDKEDPDIEKTAKKEDDGSVLGEQYNEISPLPQADDFAAIEGKEGIKLEYSFTGDDVREGLTLFQRVTIRKRNLIYTAIMALLFVFYLIDIINNPGNTFALFIAVVCVAVTGMIWIMPKTHIKKTAETADKNHFEFILTIYDNCVKVGEADRVYLLTYNKEIDRVFETDNLFMVSAGKERLFIIPKRTFNGDTETQNKVRDIFKNAMGEKFFDHTGSK